MDWSGKKRNPSPDPTASYSFAWFTCQHQFLQFKRRHAVEVELSEKVLPNGNGAPLNFLVSFFTRVCFRGNLSVSFSRIRKRMCSMKMRVQFAIPLHLWSRKFDWKSPRLFFHGITVDESTVRKEIRTKNRKSGYTKMPTAI